MDSMLLRIRTIKPGFFWDEDLAQYPPLCRIFLEGLWCAADRNGRLEDRPIMLQKLLLPYEKEDVAEQYLELLASPGPVRASAYLSRYEVGGKRYIQLLDFLKDHRPGKFEPVSAIPSPEGIVADLEAYSTAVDAKLRREVYQRDHFTCAYCGADLTSEPRKICIDHVIPLLKGGAGSRKNLVTSCKKCHGRKGERTPDEAGMVWPEGFGEKIAERPVQPALPLNGGSDGVGDPVTTPSNGGHDPVDPPSRGGQPPVDGTLTPRQHIVDHTLTPRGHDVNGTSADVNTPLTGVRPPVNGGQHVVNPPFTPGQPPVDDLLTPVDPPSTVDGRPVTRKGMESYGKEGNVDIVRRQPPSPRGATDSVLGDFGEGPEEASGREKTASDGKEGKGNIFPLTAIKSHDGGNENNGEPVELRFVAGGGRGWPKRATRFYGPTPETNEIVGYLNKKLGSNYALNGQKTLGCILDHLERGFEVNHFKSVIDRKAEQWKKDPKYSIYLRPQTLFGDNFESYVYEIDGNVERRFDRLLAACKNRTVVGFPSERLTLREGFTQEERQRALKAYADEVMKAHREKDLVALENLAKEDLMERLRAVKGAGDEA